MLEVMLPVSIFGISAVLLSLGLAIDVWQNGIQLKFLQHETIKSIELRHPHLPSLRIIWGIIACGALLFAVSLTVLSMTGLSGAFLKWMYPAVLFLDLAAFGILGEVKWKSMADQAFGTSVGTTLAFLLFLLIFQSHHILSPLMILSLSLLLLCILLSWRAFFRRWSRTTHVTGAVVGMLWIAFLVLTHS